MRTYDTVLSRYFERLGVRVINTAAAMELCKNKMLTHEVLVAAGLPTPATVYAEGAEYAYPELAERFGSARFIVKRTDGRQRRGRLPRERREGDGLRRGAVRTALHLPGVHRRKQRPRREGMGHRRPGRRSGHALFPDLVSLQLFAGRQRPGLRPTRRGGPTCRGERSGDGGRIRGYRPAVPRRRFHGERSEPATPVSARSHAWAGTTSRKNFSAIYPESSGKVKPRKKIP